MLSILALVTAGVSLLVVLGEKVAKRTKTKKDEKVVAFVEANKDKVIQVVLALLAKKGIADPEPAKAPERARVVDHRK